MQVTDIKTAIVVFNEGIFLSEEMVKFFADNPGVDITKMSLHIEYRTREEVQKQSTNKAVMVFWSKIK